MSFQPQRYFTSLSSSTTANNSSSKAGERESQSLNFENKQRSNSLDLLLRAADYGPSSSALTMNQQSSTSNNPTNNNTTQDNNNNPGVGAPTDYSQQQHDTPAAATLHNVFLQSLDQQQQQQQPQNGGLNNTSTTDNTNMSQFTDTTMSQFLAAGGGGGTSTLQQGQSQGTTPSAAQQVTSLQDVVNNNNGLAQQQLQQQSMVTNLVASLQAQQQANQQAQVQAALVRAFGAAPAAPSNVTSLGGLMGNNTAQGGLAAASAGGMRGSGIQGLSSAGGGGGLPGGFPVQGQGGSLNLSQVQQLQQQQNTAARGLLSRMQFANNNNDVAARSQQQQGISQGGQQQQDSNTALTTSNSANNNNNTNTASSSNPVTGANATGDEILQLQMEQARHNRMIQMVQNDRQERAIIANERRQSTPNTSGLMGGNGNDNNTNNDNVSGMNNVTVNSLYNQVTANNNALNSMQLQQLQQLQNNLLSNTANSMLTANGLKIPQGFHNTAAVGHSQAAAANPLSAAQAQLQNNLFAAATGTMPNFAALGAAAQLGGGISKSPLLNGGSINGVVGDASTLHLHQKLQTSRGAQIVPCRARGMPVDHNFKTAYFVIPEGIEHGDELMCSYPACRQAGVKFRYCLHCRVPVAKRNFRNRHRHGVPGGEGEEDFEEESEEEEEETGAIKTEDGGDNAICQPVGDDEDYTGVKKEHILIIPGADTNGGVNGATPMKKKKKKRRNLRVPCRARGMPMAHNFKTAYFIIPPTIEHGDELLCSFPSCRSAGAKFRYCLHCKVPVAKRNFRNRHKHGNLGDKKKGNLKTPESPGDGVGGDKKKKPEEDGGLKSEEPAAAAAVAADSGGDAAAADPEEDGKVSVSTSHDANKVQEWVKLLESKPSAEDKPAMAVWMMNLMSATEKSGAGGPPTALIPPIPAISSQASDVPVNDTSLAFEASALGINVSKLSSSSSARSSAGEEEGTASEDAINNCEAVKGNVESAQSTSSQPPKKKFKQDFEEV